MATSKLLLGFGLKCWDSVSLLFSAQDERDPAVSHAGAAAFWTKSGMVVALPSQSSLFQTDGAGTVHDLLNTCWNALEVVRPRRTKKDAVYSLGFRGCGLGCRQSFSLLKGTFLWLLQASSALLMTVSSLPMTYNLVSCGVCVDTFWPDSGTLQKPSVTGPKS